ncbi:MAG TPA: hypothetical protein VGB07_24645, partial [Blastocatellia bacterium]
PNETVQSVAAKNKKKVNTAIPNNFFISVSCVAGSAAIVTWCGLSLAWHFGCQRIIVEVFERRTDCRTD